jgi:hypothetical protein
MGDIGVTHYFTRTQLVRQTALQVLERTFALCSAVHMPEKGVLSLRLRESVQRFD